MEEITIVVVDDHPLFRQGVINTLSLEPGFKIVGQASNGAEALTMIRTLHPHIAVVDINLPGMNGQQVTHQVVQGKLSTRIVLLTAYDDHEQIIHTAWAGAAVIAPKTLTRRGLSKPSKKLSMKNSSLKTAFLIKKSLSAGSMMRWRKRVTFTASQAALSIHFLSAEQGYLPALSRE